MKSKNFLACMLAAATAMTFGNLAQADELYSGPVTQLEYIASSPPPYLMVQLNGDSSVNYFAQQQSPGCGIGGLSIDTIKIWMSMLQLSMLTEKTTQLYTKTCGSLAYIVDVVVKR